jgi:hypothetical protein
MRFGRQVDYATNFGEPPPRDCTEDDFRASLGVGAESANRLEQTVLGAEGYDLEPGLGEIPYVKVHLKGKVDGAA